MLNLFTVGQCSVGSYLCYLGISGRSEESDFVPNHFVYTSRTIMIQEVSKEMVWKEDASEAEVIATTLMNNIGQSLTNMHSEWSRTIDNILQSQLDRPILSQVRTSSSMPFKSFQMSCFCSITTNLESSSELHWGILI